MKGRYTGKLRLRQHDECSGHCCKAFTLASPGEMFARFERITDTPGHHQQEEARKIASMLIYIGTAEEHPELAAADGGDKTSPHYYTCKHFDGDRCTNYADRPRMCSDYPYAQACTYVSCTAKHRGKSGPSCHGRWFHLASAGSIVDAPGALEALQNAPVSISEK